MRNKGKQKWGLLYEFCQKSSAMNYLLPPLLLSAGDGAGDGVELLPDPLKPLLPLLELLLKLLLKLLLSKPLLSLLLSGIVRVGFVSRTGGFTVGLI